jgi:hypothetical protein
MRASICVSILVAMLLAPAGAHAAATWPSCPMIGIVTYRLETPAGCNEPQRKPWRLATAFDCETGAVRQGAGVCNGLLVPEWLAFGGYPVGMEPCESSAPGLVIAITCPKDEEPKDACPVTGQPSRRRPARSATGSISRAAR